MRQQSARNIPISMVCHTMECGEMVPIKFKIKHKDGKEILYRINETKKVQKQNHSGHKAIFYYSVITIQSTDYDVVFRFTQDTCKWELSRI